MLEESCATLPSTTLGSFLERTERSGEEGHGPQQDFLGTEVDVRKHHLGLTPALIHTTGET